MPKSVIEEPKIDNYWFIFKIFKRLRAAKKKMTKLLKVTEFLPQTLIF